MEKAPLQLRKELLQELDPQTEELAREAILELLDETEAPIDDLEVDVTTDATTDKILKLTDAELEMMIKWDEEFRAYQRQKEGLADLIQDDEYKDWDERFLQEDLGTSLNEMRPKKN